MCKLVQPSYWVGRERHTWKIAHNINNRSLESASYASVIRNFEKKKNERCISVCDCVVCDLLVARHQETTSLSARYVLWSDNLHSFWQFSSIEMPLYGFLYKCSLNCVCVRKFKSIKRYFLAFQSHYILSTKFELTNVTTGTRNRIFKFLVYVLYDALAAFWVNNRVRVIEAFHSFFWWNILAQLACF